MNHRLKYALDPTPLVSKNWTKLCAEERKLIIEAAIKSDRTDLLNDFKVLSCREDGQVIVGIQTQLGAAERGTKLLDFERLVKSKVDEGITVWAESLGDKNSLRNLRGIEVK